MSIRIIIRKGEIFTKRWNPEVRDYEEKRKTEQVLSDALQFPVTIEDMTFGQFFELICREKDLFEKVFCAGMYGHPIEPYVKEIAQPAKESKDLDYVHVYWCAEIFEGEIEVYAGFGGWGNWNATDMPEKGGIALEFTALNEYKDVPLRLDKELEIWSLEEKPKVLAKGNKEFTVYDVIAAILFEITWSGDISKGRPGPLGCEKDEAA